MTRTEWLERRRTGIGGSDIAALLHLSPWATPLMVWLDKTGRTPPREPAEAGDPMDDDGPLGIGHACEQVCADKWARKHPGLSLSAAQPELADPLHPWRRVTLDYLALDTDDTEVGPVECKTNDTSNPEGHWRDTDRLPDFYEVQLRWQIGMGGWDTGWLAAMHFGRGARFKVYKIDHDQAIWERICGTVDRFWHDHVQADVPPPATGVARETEAVADAYRDTAGAHELTPVELRHIIDLRAARATLTAAQERVDQLTCDLAVSTGGADTWTRHGQTVATYKGARRLDEQALNAAWPALTYGYRNPGRVDVGRLRGDLPRLTNRFMTRNRPTLTLKDRIK